MLKKYLHWKKKEWATDGDHFLNSNIFKLDPTFWWNITGLYLWSWMWVIYIGRHKSQESKWTVIDADQEWHIFAMKLWVTKINLCTDICQKGSLFCQVFGLSVSSLGFLSEPVSAAWFVLWQPTTINIRQRREPILFFYLKANLKSNRGKRILAIPFEYVYFATLHWWTRK